MDKESFLRKGIGALIVVFISFLLASPAMAVDSSSTHYQVRQTQFTSGTTSQSCSGSYCAKVSVGDSASGNASSTETAAKFGTITNSDPLLEVIVVSGPSDLGTLTTEKTGTKTMTVKIRNYLSDGYVMQIIGDSPKYAGHNLASSSTPVQSVPGTEQFGINATANTNPTIGANVVQVPDSTTSFGVVKDNYKTPNLFMFNSGDNVAQSTKSSGETDYTISMIVNISNATPAGHYSGDFSAVVIPVY